MFANRMMRRTASLCALALGVCAAVESHAQCCGAPAAATTFYQPAAYTAYSPVAYQTVRTGWYPGYFLDRIRARLWGSPTTYVAAYPSYTAAYAPAYSAAYMPTYAASYPTAVSYAPASYAAPAPACASCQVQSVSYAPACPTCVPAAPVAMAPACPTCPSCPVASMPAGGDVVQAVHQAPAPAPGCPTCPSVVIQNNPPAAAPPQGQQYAPDPAQQRTFGPQNAAPTLDPRATVPDRPQETQRQETDNDVIQPEPGDDPDSGAFFQPPQLFNPNDRSAGRSIAPVTMAVYEKPVGYRTVSYKPITREQAELDAAGWVSSSR